MPVLPGHFVFLLRLLIFFFVNFFGGMLTNRFFSSFLPSTLTITWIPWTFLYLHNCIYLIHNSLESEFLIFGPSKQTIKAFSIASGGHQSLTNFIKTSLINLKNEKNYIKISNFLNVSYKSVKSVEFNLFNVWSLWLWALGESFSALFLTRSYHIEM